MSTKVKVLSILLVVTMILGFAGPLSPVSAAEVTANESVVSAANAYFTNMPADVYKIAEKAFVDKVKAGENMLILDIRSAEDYGKGHVKGAVNAPWGPAIAASLDKLPGDKPIMVYCYTGQTAGQAVATLNFAGFNAKSVNLGWNLGISKVEGIADLTETTANEFPAVTAAAVKPEIKAAVAAYYDGLAAVKGTTYANYKISEDDAKKLVDTKDTSALFLSVRKAEDFVKGHIEGTINIPFGKGMEQKFDTLPKDKKIIVYCYTGQTAGQAVAGLRLLGYDAVSMHSGMGMASTVPAGWLNKGYPVVTTTQEAAAAYEYVANVPGNKYMVQVKDFIEMVKADKDMLILDIRQPDAYGKGHVKGAVNAPYGPDFAKYLDKLPSDKPIMVYCYTAQTANQTVALLRIAGFDAQNVVLGWNRGLSKDPALAEVTEVTSNDFPTVAPADIKPTIRVAIANYFKGLADVKGTIYENYIIKSAELAKLVEAKDSSIYILDIRKPEDYALGHIEGAVNMLYTKGMQQEFDKLPKDKKIVDLCYTGSGSGQLTAILRLLGYDAYSLNSGTGMPTTEGAGWINEGFPVVK